MTQILGSDGSVARTVETSSQNPSQQASSQPAASGGDPVIDVDRSNFEAQVLNASMQKPVIVDFWAPWCGPCKQLTPVLEREVRAAKGRVMLAKIDIDKNAELAQAFGVQSVPSVIVLYQGQPVGGFQGAQPESEIKKMIAQILEQIGGAAGEDTFDIDQAIHDAAEYLSQGQAEAALDLYSRILEHDEKNKHGYAGMIRAFVALGDLESAQDLLQRVPAGVEGAAEIAAAKSAIDLAQEVPAGSIADYEHKISDNPDDHDARLELARLYYQNAQAGEAIDMLLESLRRDRDWEDGKARQELLKYFDALGPSHPDVLDGRKKMSRLLFS